MTTISASFSNLSRRRMILENEAECCYIFFHAAEDWLRPVNSNVKQIGWWPAAQDPPIPSMWLTSSGDTVVPPSDCNAYPVASSKNPCGPHGSTVWQAYLDNLKKAKDPSSYHTVFASTKGTHIGPIGQGKDGKAAAAFSVWTGRFLACALHKTGKQKKGRAIQCMKPARAPSARTRT